MQKIQIKSFYGGWHEADKPRAKKFVEGLLRASLINRSAFIGHINQKMLRGITVEELLREEKEKGN